MIRFHVIFLSALMWPTGSNVSCLAIQTGFGLRLEVHGRVKVRFHGIFSGSWRLPVERPQNVDLTYFFGQFGNRPYLPWPIDVPMFQAMGP